MRWQDELGAMSAIIGITTEHEASSSQSRYFRFLQQMAGQETGMRQKYSVNQKQGHSGSDLNYYKKLFIVHHPPLYSLDKFSQVFQCFDRLLNACQRLPASSLD